MKVAAAVATPARVLPVIVLAQLLGTSSWFAVYAVMPDLQAANGWPASSVGTLAHGGALRKGGGRRETPPSPGNGYRTIR